MTPEDEAIVAEKRSYRRRRMADAARLLPVFGVAFLSIPLLWPGAEGARIPTTSAMLYIFGIWAVLAATSAAISRHLRPEEGDSGGQAGGR
jgi:hypothetical protein